MDPGVSREFQNRYAAGPWEQSTTRNPWGFCSVILTSLCMSAPFLSLTLQNSILCPSHFFPKSKSLGRWFWLIWLSPEAQSEPVNWYHGVEPQFMNRHWIFKELVSWHFPEKGESASNPVGIRYNWIKTVSGSNGRRYYVVRESFFCLFLYCDI